MHFDDRKVEDDDQRIVVEDDNQRIRISEDVCRHVTQPYISNPSCATVYLVQKTSTEETRVVDSSCGSGIRSQCVQVDINIKGACDTVSEKR